MEKTPDRRIIMKYALIFGVSLMAYNYLAYFAGVSFMVSFANVTLNFAVGTLALLVTAVKLRQESGGYIEFSTLFKMLITAVFLGTFLVVLNNMLINKVIDPSLPVKVFEASKDKMLGVVEFFGVGEEAMNEMRDQVEKNFDREKIEEQFTAGAILRTWLMSTLWWLLPAVAISAVLKKSPDVFNK